ncbi:MAG: THUMP domain-containing class I SAM-dependent RNA methyltransferase [Chitinophagales bacterium]
MREYIAKTQFGLENILEKELKQLGAKNTEVLSRAVSFEADKETLYRIHLWSSLVIRVIEPVYKFKAQDTDTLYEAIKEVDWTMIMDINDTFKIDSVVYSSFFKHSQFAGLRMKDAICDFFREETGGQRPSVDVRKPNFTFVLNIWEDEVQLSIDLTGDPLFKRRYRSQGSEAPLNEILAAGILELTNWDKKMPFLDGMCGSSTLVIEALFKATNTAPSIERKNYAFMFQPDFDSKLWYSLLDEAKETRTEDYPNIKGIEIDAETYATAKENIVRAGFKPLFHLENGDFFKYKPKEKEGILVMNPPYDVRLKSTNIKKLYKEIGDHLKKNFKGWTAYIFSGNEEARKSIGLKPAEKIKLYNGKIECRLLKFELY